MRPSTSSELPARGSAIATLASQRVGVAVGLGVAVGFGVGVGLSSGLGGGFSPGESVGVTTATGVGVGSGEALLGQHPELRRGPKRQRQRERSDERNPQKIPLNHSQTSISGPPARPTKTVNRSIEALDGRLARDSAAKLSRPPFSSVRGSCTPS